MQLNRHDKSRIKVAQNLLHYFEDYDDIDSILIGGSVCRGLSDEYSDLEIGIYWNEPISKDKRIEIINSFDSFSDEDEKIRSENVDTLVGDEVYVNGFKIDLVHCYKEYIEEIYHEVLRDHDQNQKKHTQLSILQNGIPLKDSVWLKERKESLGNIPYQLKLKTIEEHFRFLGNWKSLVHVYRKDEIKHFQTLNGLMKRMFTILCAMNNEFYPGHGKMRLFSRRFEIIPDKFDERVSKAYQVIHEDVWTVTKSLMIDVKELIEKHVPEVKTDEFTQRMKTHRRRWVFD